MPMIRRRSKILLHFVLICIDDIRNQCTGCQGSMNFSLHVKIPTSYLSRQLSATFVLPPPQTTERHTSLATHIDFKEYFRNIS